MPNYTYLAKNMKGQVVRGQVSASNDSEARVKLRAQKLTPLRLVPVGGKSRRSTPQSNPFFGKVSGKELQVFTRQFATMINAGVPVLQALEIMKNTTPSVRLREGLKGVVAGLGQGLRLTDAMEKYPQVFDRLYVNLVRAGEESGALDIVLGRLAIYQEKTMAMRGKVIGALFYPIGVIIVAICVIAALMVYVIPQFKDLFEGAGHDLPQMTRTVIVVSDYFRESWYMVLVFGVGTIAAVAYAYSTKGGRRFFDGVFLKIPVIGQLILKNGIARFTRTMSTLLGAGVSILESLDISSSVAGNVLIEEAFKRAREPISQGRNITDPLSREKVIPDMVVQMIGVGEQTGAVDQMLGKVADFYEEEVDAMAGALTSVIEPILMVGLGGVIAFIVVAMYLPIFNLAETV